MSRHIVVVGDVMLDRTIDGGSDRLCPDAPVPVLDVDTVWESPGGAGLAALLCADTGCRVTLIAPVGDDGPGRRLVELLAGRVDVLPVPQHGPTRTKTRVRSAGQPIVRLDEGGPADPADLAVGAVRDRLAAADAVLVSDYGTGLTGHDGLRAALRAAAAQVPVVWDPHPRGAPPVDGITVATPNLTEARRALADPARPGAAADGPARVARRLADRWPVRAVAVTAGAAGAFLADRDGEVRYLPARAVAGGDPCGAGDRFAATAVAALAGQVLLAEAVERAVADATAWVSGAGRPRTDRPAADSGLPVAGSTAGPIGALRSGGATLVATGGCFDIIHAGHVATLQAARRLGDRLVVLLNSDASVRRLKGPGRPVQAEQDRAAVLRALDCVDAVVVFDDDDPGRVLGELRPDVWVKGGDYGGRPLPESAVVSANGGSTVFVPYLSGRSTSGILARGGRFRPDPDRPDPDRPDPSDRKEPSR